MIKRIGAVLIAAFVLVSLSAGPSAANRKVIHDRRGDEHRSSLDIRRVKFGNAKRTIRVKARFAQLSDMPHDCATVAFGHKKRKRRGYNAIACTYSNGHTKRGLFRERRRGGGLKRVKCRGMRAKWGYSNPKVRIKVPRRCVRRIGKHKTLFRLYTKSMTYPKRKGDRTRTVKVRRG